MSSIDRELLTFFREHLAPAAAARAAGQGYFPLTRDAAVSSYYRRRHDDACYVFDLEEPDAAAQLAELWQDAPELQALINPLLTLSRSYAERQVTSEEVSPLVYAMF